MSSSKIDHTQDLVDAIKSLYLTKDASDVTLVVGGKKIQAHRTILACQSDFFEKLLINNQFKEGSLSEIPVEAPLEAFELFMQYIYTGKLEFESFEKRGLVYLELLDLAREFGVLRLEKCLIQYFVESINENNVFELFSRAILYDLSSLREKCFHEMLRGGLSTFKNPKFAEIPLNVLKEIVTSPLVKATIFKFYAVQKWLDQNTECAEADKKALVELIDVKKLSNREIIKFLGPSNLFDRSELFKILEERVADVCEEPEDLESYNFKIIEGETCGNGVKSKSMIIGSTHTIILKLCSLAYCISLTNDIRHSNVSVCKDFEGPWLSLECKTYEKFGYFENIGSSDKPFNIVKVTNDRTSFHVWGVKLGLVNGMSEEQLIQAKLIQQ